MTADPAIPPATDRRSVPRPGAVGSLGAFWPLIEPVLGSLAPRALCEVGVERGAFATRLLAWCRAHDCRYFGIDPAEVGDADFLRNVEASGGQFIQKRSSEALPNLAHCEAYFLDGDHNFFTVRGELAAIAARAQAAATEEARGPVIFVHDVGWPWGRRDMYYAPATIPDEYRHENSADLGVVPGNDGLVDGGLRSPGDYAIATRAGGERNGVLTAVEAFLADTASDADAQGPWEMFTLSVAFGLAVLYRPQSLPSACLARVEALRATARETAAFLQTLENSYLELYLHAEEIASAYRRLQTHADGVQEHARGIEKSYRDLESSYAALLAHADSLLKEYHLLDAHRRNVEAAHAQLLASVGSAPPSPSES